MSSSSEPLLDMSGIVDLYKEDARRMISDMRASSQRWREVAEGGAARQDLRRISHQLRGSGRTYGFTAVSRISKAVEKIMIKLETHTVAPDERARQSVASKIEKLATIFVE